VVASKEGWCVESSTCSVWYRMLVIRDQVSISTKPPTVLNYFCSGTFQLLALRGGPSVFLWKFVTKTPPSNVVILVTVLKCTVKASVHFVARNTASESNATDY
jgi:hypothetical protein